MESRDVTCRRSPRSADAVTYDSISAENARQLCYRARSYTHVISPHFISITGTTTGRWLLITPGVYSPVLECDCWLHEAPSRGPSASADTAIYFVIFTAEATSTIQYKHTVFYIKQKHIITKLLSQMSNDNRQKFRFGMQWGHPPPFLEAWLWP